MKQSFINWHLLRLSSPIFGAILHLDKLLCPLLETCAAVILLRQDWLTVLEGNVIKNVSHCHRRRRIIS
jgi:hypothetical protein